MDDDLVGELQCPVCLELLSWPIILPCSHVLCRDPCAERLFVHGFIRCPVCRDNSFVSGGIQNLPRVISLEHIIERVRHPPPPPPAPVAPVVEEVEMCCGPDDVPCQLCDDGERQPRPAVKSCLHCNASYCLQCLKTSHPNRTPFTEHRLVEPRRCSKPEELRCLTHDVLVNIYCEDCQTLGCLLCTDEHRAHYGHTVLTLPQAADLLKSLLEESLNKLECDRTIVIEALNNHQRTLTELQQGVDERRAAINQQCDSLINEVETKREFFLSDLEYEEKSKTECLLQQSEVWRQQGNSLDCLIQYTHDVLRETDPCNFVQLAKSVSDKVVKNIQKMSPHPAIVSSAVKLNHKVVDFRKEKATIRGLAYLTVPDTPHVDVAKCSRSTSSVVLVLCAPSQEDNVIDGYRVYYSKDEQQDIACWDVVDFKTPGETRRCGRGGTQADSAVCLMHNNLSSGTVYYFAVVAYNSFGCSEMSETIHCHTLSASESTVPVPTIVENQSRTYTYSIQLHSPSPLNCPPHPNGIEHYLLYREASVNKIWKSISLYGRVDHRVFGLEPDTLYDFVIMACDKNSECQVSNMVTMKTERSAY